MEKGSDIRQRENWVSIEHKKLNTLFKLLILSDLWEENPEKHILYQRFSFIKLSINKTNYSDQNS